MLENLSSLSKSLANLKEVVAVVLYGSHARGEAGRKSDVDLLIVTKKHDPKLEKLIDKIIDRHKAGWRVVQTVTTADELAENPYYAFEVLKDGVVLYKRPDVIELPFAIPERAVTVFTFNMSERSQKERARLDRVLYGATYRKRLKNGKVEEYRYTGAIENLGGVVLGKGSFFVPAKAEKEIEVILTKHRAVFGRGKFIMVAKPEKPAKKRRSSR